MTTRTLGSTGPEVFPIGLGCMGMSDLYGPADETESIATIHAAMEAGMTLFDTGDYYGMGHNELLLRDALRGRSRGRAIVSVKFGALRDPGGAWLGFDARPAAVKTSLAHTLRRLGTDYVDIYRPGRLDPSVPIEETVGAIAEMIKSGYVRHVGLSEVGAETLRRAHKLHPISDLQIEYSLISRGIEAEILPAARELGVGITAYGVLSRGLLSGTWSKDRATGRGDIRGFLPRFGAANVSQNLTVVEALRRVAERKGATVAQLAIGWVLARGNDIVPLVGSRRRAQLSESLRALEVSLTPEDMAAVEAAVPASAIAGTRYGAEQMRMLDSEGGAAMSRELGRHRSVAFDSTAESLGVVLFK